MKQFILAVLLLSLLQNVSMALSIEGVNLGPNIARESNLPIGLVDGKKGCACVNNAYFGPGWNPGEVITATFREIRTIRAVALYLGCSPEHGETGSGYIEARINGRYQRVASFRRFGYVTQRFFVLFDRDVRTDSLRIYLTEGGGGDRNLCISEVEIYEPDNTANTWDQVPQQGLDFMNVE